MERGQGQPSVLLRPREGTFGTKPPGELFPGNRKTHAKGKKHPGRPPNCIGGDLRGRKMLDTDTQIIPAKKPSQLHREFPVTRHASRAPRSRSCRLPHLLSPTGRRLLCNTMSRYSWTSNNKGKGKGKGWEPPAAPSGKGWEDSSRQ